MEAADTSKATPIGKVLELVDGAHVARALYVVAELAIADSLASGPKTPAELAMERDLEATSLMRVMRTLTSAGIFTQDQSGRFSLAPAGSFLRSDVPGSLLGRVRFQLGGDSEQAWSKLIEAVRSGGTGFKAAFGVEAWEYRANHPESARAFDAGMASFYQRGLRCRSQYICV